MTSFQYCSDFNVIERRCRRKTKLCMLCQELLNPRLREGAWMLISNISATRGARGCSAGACLDRLDLARRSHPARGGTPVRAPCGDMRASNLRVRGPCRPARSTVRRLLYIFVSHDPGGASPDVQRIASCFQGSASHRRQLISRVNTSTSTAMQSYTSGPLNQTVRTILPNCKLLSM